MYKLSSSGSNGIGYPLNIMDNLIVSWHMFWECVHLVCISYEKTNMRIIKYMLSS